LHVSAEQVRLPAHVLAHTLLEAGPLARQALNAALQRLLEQVAARPHLAQLARQILHLVLHVFERVLGEREHGPRLQIVDLALQFH
jgi:hypothetical protein